MSLPEISTVVAVAIAVGGALYALRRQGNQQAAIDNTELSRRVRQLETNNKFLLDEISKIEHDNERMREHLSLVQEELRDWKRRYETLTDENAALVKALGRNA